MTKPHHRFTQLQKVFGHYKTNIKKKDLGGF